MSSAPHPTGRNTMSSPRAANMSPDEKKALLQSKETLTITWTDKGSSKPVSIENVPKAVFLAFCPQARRHFQNSPRGTAATAIYDFGVQADLAPAAVRYLIGAMLAACRAPGAGAALPPAFPDPANVLNRLKCLAAVKRLGVARFVEYAWRNAAMDAVRAAGRVTLGELAYAHVAFGGVDGDAEEEKKKEQGEEPGLLRHILNCAVYAELTDEVEHPETLAINRYAYGSHPALAVMKKAVEVEVEKKLVQRREKEEEKEEKAKERREAFEKKAKRGLAEKKKQDRLEQARNGERALDDEEVKAMHMAKYAGPQTATVSHRLR